MSHPIYRVQSFEIVADYVLRILFNDNIERIVDFQSILAADLYEPLRDLALFNQVRIDPDAKTLVWPNDADFDPVTLYNWAIHGRALAQRLAPIGK